MKLREGLILRKVADQYVVVPIGRTVQDVTAIVYISSSAAYLWDYMQENDFGEEDLVKRIMEHYSGVTEETARADIEKFLETLKTNNILDDGQKRGKTFVRLPERFKRDDKHGI